MLKLIAQKNPWDFSTPETYKIYGVAQQNVATLKCEIKNLYTGKINYRQTIHAKIPMTALKYMEKVFLKHGHLIYGIRSIRARTKIKRENLL